MVRSFDVDAGSEEEGTEEDFFFFFFFSMPAGLLPFSLRPPRTVGAYSSVGIVGVVWKGGGRREGGKRLGRRGILPPWAVRRSGGCVVAATS